jgi:ribosomal protein L37E
MKERPILFSAPMVNAILDGIKMMTRRVVNPQPILVPEIKDGGITVDESLILPDGDQTQRVKDRKPPFGWNIKLLFLANSKCLHGGRGDRLWVRETFATGYGKVFYRATDDMSSCGMKVPWKPSIFMPRKASRITLEIVSVRVERVQDISETDAIHEGVQPCGHDSYHTDQHTCAFQSLWDSLNAKRGYGWAKNPWVWVIEFKRI